MKAVVQDKYGSADVLELKDIDKPMAGDDELLVRVHAAAVDPGVWHMMTGLPYVFRLAMGLRAPERGMLRVDVAGRVEAVGKNVTQVQAGGRGVRQRRRRPSPSTPASARSTCAPKPANLTFEQAAAVAVSGLHRPAGPARQGTGPAGAEGPDQRRGGRRGHVRRADRQGFRRRGDRRVQHRERGPGPLHRRRPRHRLHPGGLHPERDARYDLLLDTVGQPFDRCSCGVPWLPRERSSSVGGEGGGRWLGPVRGAAAPGPLLSLFASRKLIGLSAKVRARRTCWS